MHFKKTSFVSITKQDPTYFQPESDAKDWPVISSSFLTSPESIVAADTVTIYIKEQV